MASTAASIWQVHPPNQVGWFSMILLCFSRQTGVDIPEKTKHSAGVYLNGLDLNNDLDGLRKGNGLGGFPSSKSASSTGLATRTQPWPPKRLA
ncbi:hypothetical protein ACO2Q8_16885 [Larkinella sp. VNQ87]|uniref:hypothetical protein n=1 Tax=Larkinella sp. VNQ87 TaxID=3400921 RepID=UPI003C0B3F7D